jgi:hypothetical protein
MLCLGLSACPGGDDDSADDDSTTGDDDDSTAGDDDTSPADDDDTSDDDDSGDDDSADDDSADDDDTSGDDDDEATPEEWTFGWIYENVISGNNSAVSEGCGCHFGSTHSSGMTGLGDQDGAYAAWVNQAATSAGGAPTGLDRVEPGSSVDSYVMYKLDGNMEDVGGGGSRMPLSGPPYLDEATRDIIRNWIDEGALDN